MLGSRPGVQRIVINGTHIGYLKATAAFFKQVDLGIPGGTIDFADLLVFVLQIRKGVILLIRKAVSFD
jgi:hypothetical protein